MKFFHDQRIGENQYLELDVAKQRMAADKQAAGVGNDG